MGNRTDCAYLLLYSAYNPFLTKLFIFLVLHKKAGFSSQNDNFKIDKKCFFGNTGGDIDDTDEEMEEAEPYTIFLTFQKNGQEGSNCIVG